VHDVGKSSTPQSINPYVGGLFEVFEVFEVFEEG
jgi:hypothetical protein